MKLSIEKLRIEYGSASLLEEALHPNPMKQFERWFKETLKAKIFEPNAMTLATVSYLGKPSSRTVLLKQIDENGFVFFTDYQSRKGLQLETCPFGSLTFWWREIYRQVCIEGKVKKISREASRLYFEKRPRGAQIAAHASQQSIPLASRFELEEVYARIKKRFAGKKIPCPSHWGGYCLIPDRIEFWQGKENRLHDRFLYVKANGEWTLTRLSP